MRRCVAEPLDAGGLVGRMGIRWVSGRSWKLLSVVPYSCFGIVGFGTVGRSANVILRRH